MAKLVSISMSDQKIVDIDPAEWPLVAKGQERDEAEDGNFLIYDRPYMSIDERVWELYVRRHKDGTYLVYGHSIWEPYEGDVYDADEIYNEEDIFAGYCCTREDVRRTVMDVSKTIESRDTLPSMILAQFEALTMDPDK